MPNHLYKIPRVTDAQIGHALVKLGKEFGDFDVNFNVMQQGLGQVKFPNYEGSAIWERILKLNGELVDHFSASLGGATFHYWRGGQMSDPAQKSPVLDDLSIDLNGIDEQRMLVASKILAHFRPVSLPKNAKPDDAIVAQRAIQEATFTRLEMQLEQLFQQTVVARQKLDEAAQEKAIELEALFLARQREADADVEKRQAELNQQAEMLKKRAEELDDSDNTFARRKIRDGMLSDVTDRVKNFDVSDATRRSRTPVLIGMYLLIGMFAVSMILTGFELTQSKGMESEFAVILKNANQSATPARSAPASLVSEVHVTELIRLLHDVSNEKIALWIRLSLLTFGLVGSLIFYIRWQSRWAEQFAITEQSLKQFHLDVNRANWVVETCLEWQKETNSSIPSSLVESLTRGLFTKEDSLPQALHPSDELASALMGSASRLSLAIGENKLEFDKPGKIPKSIPPT